MVTFSSSLLCVFFLLTIYTSSVNQWLVFFLLIGHKKEGEGEGILQYSYLQKGGAAENLKEPLPWMMKKEVTKSWQCIYDKITLSLKSFSSPPFIFVLVYFCPCPGNWKENLRAHSHHLLTHEMTLSSDTYCILLFYVMSFFFNLEFNLSFFFFFFDTAFSKCFFFLKKHKFPWVWTGLIQHHVLLTYPRIWGKTRDSHWRQLLVWVLLVPQPFSIIVTMIADVL